MMQPAFTPENLANHLLGVLLFQNTGKILSLDGLANLERQFYRGL
ncbi:MAG TPA: hypothetical protein VIH59_00125 [Candidatus Tectomicrobia bacterium]|jgi:hypothetical protein